MNIPVPKGMKSPTVIIVGGGTMSGEEKHNSMHEKRMDMLERKLDQQYKNKVEGKNYSKDIEAIQKSFVNRLDRFINQSKKKIDSLEDAIRKISLKTKTVNVNRSVNLDSSFEKLFSRMEKAIREARPRVSPSPS